MKEFNISSENHQVVSQSASNYLNEIMDSGSNAIMTIAAEDNYVGKWGMAKLWLSCVASCSKFMADNGATMPLVMKNGAPTGTRPFNADDGHYLFTVKCMGQDEHGNRLSWARKDHGGMKAANQGQRLHAMRQLHEWATERGIQLYNPRDSQYQELLSRENN